MRVTATPAVVHVILCAAAILSLLPVQMHSIPNTYIEDFSTKEFCDTLNTTAWWDTIAGELKLFPFELTLAGSCDTPGNAYGVAISGDYTYVADEFAGLQVIDISDPAAPALAGSCDTPGYTFGVAISGDYAYVADYTSGLQVIDISDPTNPTLAGNYDTPGFATCVAISGDYGYVADGGSGLQVIDISDPSAPAFAGSCVTPDYAYGVAIEGDYAYVADLTSGLLVIDISNPTAPTFAGSYDTPGLALGVAISGDYAYVADEEYGLQVLDISDPTAPSYAGSYDTPSAEGVAVSGDYAYVADWGSCLLVIDISDPTAPSYVGNYDIPGAAHSVAISGNNAYLGGHASGLLVIDICYSTEPLPVGSYDTPGRTFGVAVSGDYVYVGDFESGLQVLDISDPTSPTIAGNYDTPDGALSVAIAGDYAYVADHESGLQVIDINDPTAPTSAGSYDTPGIARDVAISGDYAYVGDYSSGLQVIDISDPTNPSYAGSYATTGNALGVDIAGDYAYVAYEGPGLLVIDISDPTTPSYAGSYDTPGYARDVVISGDYAYVADYSSGLQVIDISDPTNPTLAGVHSTPDYAYGVAISGDYAYVATYFSGLQVIDISDPTAPSYAGSYDTPDRAYGVTISGNYAYVGDELSGLQVIQVFQHEIDTENNVGWSLAVDASSDTIFGARITTTQTDTVTWELSADGGSIWQGIALDGSWYQLAVPGIDLVWRSTLTGVARGCNPIVTELQIDWLVEAALVDSIVDVPDDQGGWVLMNFTRSGRDFQDEAVLPISCYGIWRRVDDEALVSALEPQAPSMTEKDIAAGTPDLSGMPVTTYGGNLYIQSRPDLAASSFPPGTWVCIATVPAVQEDTYIAAVPTAVDSSSAGTNNTVFVITAHTTTPSIWYVSEPDSGYSVDNIAPGVPTGLMIAYNTGSGTELSWDECPDSDFQCFSIYRDDTEEFEPSPENLVHMTASSAWTDPIADGWQYTYKITAIDCNGNESGAASAETVTGDETPSSPKTFALRQNVPNPFNPSTRIRFDLPRAAHVRLDIYDVSGRLVRTLVDSEMKPGNKEVIWDGKDTGGRETASGIYFYRLTASDFVQTKKMVLLR